MSGANTEYLFTASQLTVGYHGSPLIRDIEIRLRQGQILTLIGPNGSGKSTILKSITKHLKTISGTVYIRGRSIDDMAGREMAREVSVVLTEKLRTELLTCADIVATGRYPHTGMLGILSQRDWGHVQSAMELVDAWELRDRDFTEISDGQRQRVMLARAICQEPQIIVLDEPTSFLDIRYSLELLGILRTMAEERGIAVVMSLHELDLAQKVSDLVMCVKGETITHCASPREVFVPEIIESLYDLSDGSYNPLLGSFEMAPPQGEPKVFVIAGGGTGAMEYRALQRKRIPFATGVLHENDIDYQIAQALSGRVLAEKAFNAISDDLYAQAVRQMEACETVIQCLSAYGELNAKNRQLYDRAITLGLRVVNSADAIWG